MEKTNYSFYCEKTRLETDRQECDFCEDIVECRNTGYLAKVDREHDFSTAGAATLLGERQLNALYKRTQRALEAWDPKYKLWFQRRIQGTIGYRNFEITRQDVADALKAAHFENIDVDEVHRVTMDYLLMYEMWQKNAGVPKAIADWCEKLGRATARFLSKLEDDPSEKEALDAMLYKEGIDRGDLIIMVGRLLNFIEEIRESKPGNMPDFAFKRYVWQLSQIFRRCTGKEPTVSYVSETGHRSLFFRLVECCIANFYPATVQKNSTH